MELWKKMRGLRLWDGYMPLRFLKLNGVQFCFYGFLKIGSAAKCNWTDPDTGRQAAHLGIPEHKHLKTLVVLSLHHNVFLPWKLSCFELYSRLFAGDFTFLLEYDEIGSRGSSSALKYLWWECHNWKKVPWMVKSSQNNDLTVEGGHCSASKTGFAIQKWGHFMVNWFELNKNLQTYH